MASTYQEYLSNSIETSEFFLYNHIKGNSWGLER